MRVNFVLSEVATGLRRNLTMTVAMILTTAISLGLMGTGLLIAGMISDMKDIFYDKVQVSIFLADDVTEEQRAAIETQLSSSSEVKSFVYENKDEAYERFREQFSQQPGAHEAERDGRRQDHRDRHGEVATQPGGHLGEHEVDAHGFPVVEFGEARSAGCVATSP